MVHLKQLFQIRGPALYVLSGIETILDAELRSRIGHQLHKSASALRRNSLGVESTLVMDDALEKIAIDTAGLARGREMLVDRFYWDID